jgi:CheY-like chemotaxis protein
MKRAKLILIEDSPDGANAISTLLENSYKIVPVLGKKVFENLVSCYAKYNISKYSAEERQKARTNIAIFLLQNLNDVKCFIIDYMLKESSVEHCNGVSFYTDFSEEIGTLPVLFLTSTNKHSEILRLIKYKDDNPQRAGFGKSEKWKIKPEFKEYLFHALDKLVNKKGMIEGSPA